MKKRYPPQTKLVALFPAVLLYYEIIFRFVTVGGIFKWGTIHMILFCISYGGLGYLLSTIFRKRKWNRYCVTAYLAVSALPFLIEYFVFRKFKILYNLNTVFGGASDAVGSYSSDIFDMIFSFSGLFTIILYLLPAVLYFIFGKDYINPRRSNRRRRLIVVFLAAVIYVFNFLLIMIIPSQRAMWKTQYKFETAASNFGLITGIGLDIRDIIFGSSRGSFDLEEVPEEPEESADEAAVTPEPTPEVIEYGLNQLDIDFASLEGSEEYLDMNAYINSLTPSSQHEYTGLFKGKNLIFLTAEAFSKEVIDEDLTPTLYRLATKGIQVKEFYQPGGCGTTGGEFQNIFGSMPMDDGQSFKNSADNYNYYTMGSMLNRQGYYGKVFHNNSYTYYDRNITHNNIGYSDGFMGVGNGMEEYVTKNWPQSDLEMMEGTVPLYIDKQPFNIYYMTVSGHSDYSRDENSMTIKNWDRVQHLDYSDPVKGYLAAQLELEDALTSLVSQLEAAGIADDTVICMTSDHFPYGLDDNASLGDMPYLSELYGYNVETTFQRDHNALILWSGCLEDSEPIVVEGPCYSVDLVPTLANLFGVEFDSRLLPGRDFLADTKPIVYYDNYDWISEYGEYDASSSTFTPREGVTVPEGHIEETNRYVQNKLYFSSGLMDLDYYRYLFEK